MMKSLRTERGALVLGMAILLAVICSIAAYTMLIAASAEARRGQALVSGIRSRYLAEAGMTWATQRLWVDPTFCPTNLPVPLAGGTVQVTVTNCGTPNQQIITRVIF